MMKHLMKDANYGALYKALEKDSPEVAHAMSRMSDSVSAAIEIVSNQLEIIPSRNPHIVVALATEIFRDSRPEQEPELEE